MRPPAAGADGAELAGIADSGDFRVAGYREVAEAVPVAAGDRRRLVDDPPAAYRQPFVGAPQRGLEARGGRAGLVAENPRGLAFDRHGGDGNPAGLGGEGDAAQHGGFPAAGDAGDADRAAPVAAHGAHDVALDRIEAGAADSRLDRAGPDTALAPAERVDDPLAAIEQAYGEPVQEPRR